MKRSEALFKIENFILDNYALEYLTFSPKEVAEKTLEFIEKELNMLPPGDKYTVHGVVTHLNNEWDRE